MLVLDHAAYVSHLLMRTASGAIKCLLGASGTPPVTVHDPSHQHAIFITGCSSGIGRDAAMALAKAGFKVFAGVRRTADGDALEAALGACQTPTPTILIPVICDVADVTQIQSAFTTIKEDLKQTNGKLIALVNNAGISCNIPLELASMNDVKLCMDVNTYGVLRVSRQICMPFSFPRAHVLGSYLFDSLD